MRKTSFWFIGVALLVFTSVVYSKPRENSEIQKLRSQVDSLTLAIKDFKTLDPTKVQVEEKVFTIALESGKSTIEFLKWCIGILITAITASGLLFTWISYRTGKKYESLEKRYETVESKYKEYLLKEPELIRNQQNLRDIIDEANQIMPILRHQIDQGGAIMNALKPTIQWQAPIIPEYQNTYTNPSEDNNAV